MNRKVNKKTIAGLLGTAVLGASLIGSIAPANAASRDVKEARKDVKEERKDVRKEQKDVRKADTRAERKDAREDVRDAKQDLRRERQDLKQEKREDRRDNRPAYNNRPGYNNGPFYNNRPVYNNRPAYGHPIYNPPVYNNGNNGYQTLTGQVTQVKSDQRFAVRVGGQTFEVISNSPIRNLDRGDIVRIYGVRSGNNDIRNANVSIIDNR